MARHGNTATAQRFMTTYRSDRQGNQSVSLCGGLPGPEFGRTQASTLESFLYFLQYSTFIVPR